MTTACKDSTIKVPVQILIECQEQDTKLNFPLGREWGWRCIADESLLKFKSDHTVYSAKGHSAHEAAIGKVKRDARNQLGETYEKIEYECTSIHRAPRYKKIEDAAKKIVYPIIYPKSDGQNEKVDKSA